MQDTFYIREFCSLIAQFPRHMVLGPGCSQLWKLGEDFDVWTNEAVRIMRENHVNVINPLAQYFTFEKEVRR